MTEEAGRAAIDYIVGITVPVHRVLVSERSWDKQTFSGEKRAKHAKSGDIISTNRGRTELLD